MLKCFGKRSCMSTKFPIAIMNGITCFLYSAKTATGSWKHSADKLNSILTICIFYSIHYMYSIFYCCCELFTSSQLANKLISLN